MNSPNMLSVLSFCRQAKDEQLLRISATKTYTTPLRMAARKVLNERLRIVS